MPIHYSKCVVTATSEEPNTVIVRLTFSLSKATPLRKQFESVSMLGTEPSPSCWGSLYPFIPPIPGNKPCASLIHSIPIRAMSLAVRTRNLSQEQRILG